MSLRFAICFALCIFSVSEALGQTSSYNLVIYANDDSLTCRLNGKLVASLSNAAATYNLSVRPGKNVLICEPRDRDRGRCWQYGYRVMRDNVSLFDTTAICCADGCPLPPDSITTKFVAP